MSDYTDRYKKAMAPAVDKWGKHSVECGKELAPINKDIEELEKNKKTSPDEAKMLVAVCDTVHRASAALKLDLLSIPLPRTASRASRQQPRPRHLRGILSNFRIGLTLKWKF
jgi:hypothetical protein